MDLKPPPLNEWVTFNVHKFFISPQIAFPLEVISIWKWGIYFFNAKKKVVNKITFRITSNKLLDAAADNNTETTDNDEKKTDNLRHQLNDSDLQRLCQRQQEENNELKIKMEASETERKKFIKTYVESFHETADKIDKANETGINMGDCLV